MRTIVAGSILILASAIAWADSCEPDASIRGARALEAALASCEEVARVATSNDVRFAALCRGSAYAFELAEPKSDRSSDLAHRGVELADRARTLVPDRVEGHYRYALALGIYLRENKLAAMTKVDDLIAAAKRAVVLDETYDHGGPHRLLALLYAEAPRFVGPGDRDLARKHLARLLAIAGDYEENKLVAVTVHHEIGEDDRARRLLESVDPDRAPDEPSRRELRSERDRLRKELED